VRRRHEPQADAPRPPWALLSFLLRYPDERLVEARGEAAEEVADLPAGPVREALERFLAGMNGDVDALAARYVETFDLRRRASLHLTWYTHGDTRKRGMALLRLKKLYRADGLPLATSELPDHLCVMLAYAELAPPGHGEALLEEHRAPLELLRLSLHDDDSVYAHLLDAVSSALGEVSDSDRAEVLRLVQEGPPEEAVGLEPFAPPEVMPMGARP
jgi:nitrate reductase delta subunit